MYRKGSVVPVLIAVKLTIKYRHPSLPLRSAFLVRVRTRIQPRKNFIAPSFSRVYGARSAAAQREKAGKIESSVESAR
jgi:hypothetical protein